LNYIKERIVERPQRLKKLIKRIIVTIPVAIVFGVVACVAFVVLKPHLEKALYKEPETTETQEEETTGDGEESATPVYTPEDLREIYGQLTEVRKEIQKSIVVVDAYNGEKEMFETIEDEIISSGVILAADRYIDILVISDNVWDKDHIKVTFFDGAIADAEVSRRDTVTGVAVIRVPREKVSSETVKQINIAKMAVSGDFPAKDPIIYMGNPFDVNLYDTLGFVANQSSISAGLDIGYKVVQTDIFISSCNNGFIFDLDGYLSGVVVYNEQVVAAISIMDIRHIVESLCNEDGIIYMGIYGETITDEIREISGIDMPDGVYVTKVEKNSPAYMAGIRKGDIITKMGNIIVQDVLAVKRCLQKASSGNKLSVVVSRQNNDEFDTYTLEVELSEREE